MKPGDSIYVADLVFADVPRAATVRYANQHFLVIESPGLLPYQECIDLHRGDRTAAPTLKEFFAKRAEVYEKTWKKLKELMESKVERHGTMLGLADMKEEDLERGEYL